MKGRRAKAGEKHNISIVDQLSQVDVDANIYNDDVNFNSQDSVADHEKRHSSMDASKPGSRESSIQLARFGKSVQDGKARGSRDSYDRETFVGGVSLRDRKTSIP